MRADCFIWYISNGFHLAKILRSARIFVRGHYLFQDENSFRERNCKLRATHFFVPNEVYCIYCPSNTLATRWCSQTMYSLLRVGCLVFSVLWYDSINKHRCPFFCNNSWTLSHLKLNFKRFYRNRRKVCPRIIPSFSKVHFQWLGQSRACKTTTWILTNIRVPQVPGRCHTTEKNWKSVIQCTKKIRTFFDRCFSVVYGWRCWGLNTFRDTPVNH